MVRTTTASSRGTRPSAAKGAKRQKPNVKIPAKLLADETGPVDKHWRVYFLEALAATSNVTAACAVTGAGTARAYLTRAGDPEFAAQWRAALARGYENLELELLGYLRNPDPAVKMDVTGAIRLLTMHRESVAQQRAHEDHRSKREVLESLDAMIDAMRQRRLANAQLAALPPPGDEA